MSQKKEKEIKFPEDIIQEKFESGEIDFETAEKQLKNLVNSFKKRK